jgi:rare lipoprotein A
LLTKNKRLKIFVLLISLILNLSLKGQEASADSTKQINQKVYYGTASYYAEKFNGRKTANGEVYDSKKYTAACNILPLGTWIRVTNLRNKKSVVVKVNDRLHPRMKRIVDMSGVAAEYLGYKKRGLTQVKVEALGKKKPSQ